MRVSIDIRAVQADDELNADAQRWHDRWCGEGVWWKCRDRLVHARLEIARLAFRHVSSKKVNRS